jgi:hypothetical protein
MIFSLPAPLRSEEAVNAERRKCQHVCGNDGDVLDTVHYERNRRHHDGSPRLAFHKTFPVLASRAYKKPSLPGKRM